MKSFAVALSLLGVFLSAGISRAQTRGPGSASGVLRARVVDLGEPVLELVEVSGERRHFVAGTEPVLAQLTWAVASLRLSPGIEQHRREDVPSS